LLLLLLLLLLTITLHHYLALAYGTHALLVGWGVAPLC
jgi:hypothetical protein